MPEGTEPLLGQTNTDPQPQDSETQDPSPKPAGDTPQADPQPKPAGDDWRNIIPEAHREMFKDYETPEAAFEAIKADREAATQAREGVPEKAEDYKVELPDGYVATDEEVNGFKSFAHEKGWSQKQVQDALEFDAQRAKSMGDAHQKQVQGWETQCRELDGFKGADFEQGLADAKRGLDLVGTPELKKVLLETGYGSHPEVVAMFKRIADMAGGKSMPDGDPSRSGGSGLDKMYPNSPGMT